MRLLRFDTPTGPHLGSLEGDQVRDLTAAAPGGPLDFAAWLYGWAPLGTGVWVHP